MIGLYLFLNLVLILSLLVALYCVWRIRRNLDEMEEALDRIKEELEKFGGQP